MSSNGTASASGISVNQNDPVFKSIGLALAITSGVFIGSSFVFKKKGLLQAQKQAGSEAGKGHGYLSNGLWWFGMILMIIGEIFNFVAYAFTQAILVTPLGALSVVISAILSSIFLKERLNNQGKIGCAQCIIGATIIVLHAPNQHVAATIPEFQNMFFAPVFLTYAIVSILGSLVIIWKIAPKYGSRYMFVYIGICSLIGSLSVVTTQGIGTAIVKTAQGDNQFTHWFLYVLAAFVVITLLTEVNYLNKALNLFNTAMVTPVYYVTFTSLTIISSAILSQGFEAPPVSVVTVVMGFLVICSGIILLQYSKVSGIDSTIVGSPTETIGGERSLSGADFEPGASEIRASFGSIRRYSMSTGKTYPVLPHTMPPQNKEPGNFVHRRSQSLNYGIFRNGDNNNGLPTINESNIGRKATSKSLTNPRTEPIIETDGNSDQTRSAAVRFSSSPVASTSSSASISTLEDNQENINGTQRKTPIIHTTSSSVSSTTISNSYSPTKDSKHNDDYFSGYSPLKISPPSPLQHPITYIKQHLSPTISIFSDNGTINSETYSGNPDIRRESNNSISRRSQNSIGFVDKLRLNRSASGGSEDDFNDDEILVNST